MDTIEELFAESSVVSTSAVARAFELSESNARAWAVEIEVSKVGASFGWTREDVEELAEQLEAPDDDDQGSEDDEEPESDEDDDDESEDE